MDISKTMILPGTSTASLISENSMGNNSHYFEVKKNISSSFANLKEFNIIFYGKRALFRVNFIFFDTFGNLVTSMTQIESKESAPSSLNPVTQPNEPKMPSNGNTETPNSPRMPENHLEALLDDQQSTITLQSVEDVSDSTANNLKDACNSRFYFSDCYMSAELEILKFISEIKVTFGIDGECFDVKILGHEKTFEKKIEDFRKSVKVSSNVLKIFYNRRNPMSFFEKLKTTTKFVYRSSLHVNFSSERGMDAGGPRREFVTLLFKEILTKKGIYMCTDFILTSKASSSASRIAACS